MKKVSIRNSHFIRGNSLNLPVLVKSRSVYLSPDILEIMDDILKNYVTGKIPHDSADIRNAISIISIVRHKFS